MAKVFYWGLILAALIAAIRHDGQAMELFLLAAILIRLDAPKESESE